MPGWLLRYEGWDPSAEPLRSRHLTDCDPRVEDDGLVVLTVTRDRPEGARAAPVVVR